MVTVNSPSVNGRVLAVGNHGVSGSVVNLTSPERLVILPASARTAHVNVAPGVEPREIDPMVGRARVAGALATVRAGVGPYSTVHAAGASVVQADRRGRLGDALDVEIAYQGRQRASALARLGGDRSQRYLAGPLPLASSFTASVCEPRPT